MANLSINSLFSETDVKTFDNLMGRLHQLCREHGLMFSTDYNKCSTVDLPNAVPIVHTCRNMYLPVGAVANATEGEVIGCLGHAFVQTVEHLPRNTTEEQRLIIGQFIQFARREYSLWYLHS